MEAHHQDSLRAQAVRALVDATRRGQRESEDSQPEWDRHRGKQRAAEADRDGGRNALYATILLPIFILTEFVPALMFAYAISKWGKLRFEHDQER